MALSPEAICTLADVRERLDLAPEEVEDDETLEQHIEAVSEIFNSVREFKSYDPAEATRTFDVIGRGYRISIPIDDLATLTSVTYLGSDITDLCTPLPRNRRPHEPITRLRIASTLTGDEELEITGTWGFPSVPHDVFHAVVETVIQWFKEDSRHGPVYQDVEGIEREQRALPRDAFEILTKYAQQRL